MSNRKEILRKKRHKTIRMRISGTAQRPRLVIRRSLNNIHAQALDDVENKVLFSLSTLDKEVKSKLKNAGNIKAAEFFGELFARRAQAKGVSAVIFDRAGYLYHGRVKAFADGLRKGGLKF